jgi:hypothetical protein
LYRLKYIVLRVSVLVPAKLSPLEIIEIIPLGNLNFLSKFSVIV